MIKASKTDVVRRELVISVCCIINFGTSPLSKTRYYTKHSRQEIVALGSSVRSLLEKQRVYEKTLRSPSLKQAQSLFPEI